MRQRIGSGVGGGETGIDIELIRSGKRTRKSSIEPALYDPMIPSCLRAAVAAALVTGVGLWLEARVRAVVVVSAGGP
jgi:hypothetical protein